MWGGGLGRGGGGLVRGVRVDVNKVLKFLRKFKKNWGGGRGGGGRVGGVRVEMNEDLKFFAKIQKKYYFFLGGGGRGRVLGGGSGWM